MHVVKVLANLLADRVRDFEPDVIIGLPTLGLTLAPLVAEKLGMGEFIFCLLSLFVA
jgi:adenine/guanine phosphoribosyltransferase-like PRPP-binding protein